MSKKRIAILGATGSVGESAVRVARAMKDTIEVVALSAHSNADKLASLAREFHCKTLVIGDPSKRDELASLLPQNSRVLTGEEGLVEIASDPETDLILCAIVGTGGLLPCIEAAKHGKTIALASKEVMVMAGSLFTAAARKHNAMIIPVDSEHSALFQCLQAGKRSEVNRLILTASGGPFRNMPLHEMEKITPEEALRHPTWNMGPKVTLDSATLMNKALEMIEAHFLFDMPQEKIDVLIHPQSIIHSLVEFIDGAVIAHMTPPDMAFPVQYALAWPERLQSPLQRLNLAQIKTLDFYEHDSARFPSIDYARFAMNAGKTMPAVLNAANEVAVERFRNGEIRFTGIWKIIEYTINKHECLEDSQLDAILNADQWARVFAKECKV